MGMFTKPLSGQSYTIALLIRAGVIFAVFAAAFTLFSLSMGDCSAASGACGAGMAVVIYATVAAFAIFLLSIVGISVRRARDAGWHPLVGLLPVLTPFTFFLGFLGVLPSALAILVLPMPLNIPWLLTMSAFCSARTKPRWQSANNRPPRI